jgi:hypothetical protein
LRSRAAISTAHFITLGGGIARVVARPMRRGLHIALWLAGQRCHAVLHRNYGPLGSIFHVVPKQMCE